MTVSTAAKAHLRVISVVVSCDGKRSSIVSSFSLDSLAQNNAKALIDPL